MSQPRRYTSPLKDTLELFCPKATPHHIPGGPHICPGDPNLQHPHVKAFSSPGLKDSDIDDLIIRGSVIAEGKTISDDGKNEIWAIWTWKGKFYAQALRFSPAEIRRETTQEVDIIPGLIPALTPQKVKGYGEVLMSQHISDRLAQHIGRGAEEILSIESLIKWGNNRRQNRTSHVFEWTVFRFTFRTNSAG